MESASPDFRQRLRVASRRLGLTAFWRWWVDELAPLVPSRLRNMVGRIRMRPVLVWGESEAVLWVPQVADSRLAYREVVRIPLTGDDDSAGRAAIEALSNSSSVDWADRPRVVVALPPSQVLRKTITLPAAVEDNLAQVLAYDLDRHTPFKPDEVYFDARIVERDKVKKELRIDWAAALRTIVAEVRRRAESWGASVVAVTPDRPPAPALPSPATLNLLPANERPDTAGLRGWEVWVPLGLLVAAVLFATALPLWQKRGYAIALQQQAMQGRAAADASNALREQLERLTGEYNFALSRKYAFPSALQSVEDLSKLLPDDTWLTQLEVKNQAKGKDAKREIVVRGESANAGRLISLFEESNLFTDAAPRSPTTKIQPGPGEIFDVGAQLKPLPPPIPVQLAGAGEIASLPTGSAPAGAPPGQQPKPAEAQNADASKGAAAPASTKAPAKADAAPQAASVPPPAVQPPPAVAPPAPPAAATPAPPPAAATRAAPPAAATPPPAPAVATPAAPPTATATEPPAGARPTAESRGQRPDRRATQ